jgi:hypothetical protein
MPIFSYVLAATGGGGGGGFAALPGLVHETDHAGYGLARVLAQYVPAVRLRSILDILLDGEAVIGGGPLAPTGIQSAEDLAWQCYTERGLVEVEDGGPAIGEQLDVIGRIVGLDRLAVFGGSDDVYRAVLGLKIAVNRSNGTLGEILAMLEVAAAIAGSTDPVAGHEFYPAAFRTEISELPGAAAAAAIWFILAPAKPAGVRWDFLWSITKAEYLFTYSSELATTESDTDRGYGDLNTPPVDGGRLMGLIT